jgi:hypothetical protein
MKLSQFFLLFLPYKITTISSQLSKPQVMERLTSKFIPAAVVGEDTFWTSSCQYRGHDLGDRFQIDGPFGHKRWTLFTQGNIFSTDKGSSLKLKLTLSIFHLLSAIFVLSFYGIGCIFVMHFPFWQIIAIQELFFYGGILLIFHWEVEKLLLLIKEALKNPE